MEPRPGPFGPPGARIRLQQQARSPLTPWRGGAAGARTRLFLSLLAPRPGAAAAHIRVPDSASVSPSNVPSAPEPDDVSRHAFCPSSRPRPNAPFQLLRTGRWRRAPGGSARTAGSFCPSRPRHSQSLHAEIRWVEPSRRRLAWDAAASHPAPHPAPAPPKTPRSVEQTFEEVAPL